MLKMYFQRIAIISAGLALCTAAAQAAPVDSPSFAAPIAAHETAAHKIWSVRAALNVAALQCQFSPFLGSVRTYNQFLQHHDSELKNAHDLLMTRFRKDHGARQGMQLFDRYLTRTYNGFSALDAQRSFCNAAAQVGRQALFLRKGQFQTFADTALSTLRHSLTVPGDQLTAVSLRGLRLPDIERCYDQKGRLRKKCNAAITSIG